MNQDEFNQAWLIARSDESLLLYDDVDLDGCGLPRFEPRATTLKSVAYLLRYQCFRLDGSIDTEELEQCRLIARKKFILVDSLAEEGTLYRIEKGRLVVLNRPANSRRERTGKELREVLKVGL